MPVESGAGMVTTVDEGADDPGLEGGGKSDDCSIAVELDALVSLESITGAEDGTFEDAGKAED